MNDPLFTWWCPLEISSERLKKKDAARRFSEMKRKKNLPSISSFRIDRRHRSNCLTNIRTAMKTDKNSIKLNRSFNHRWEHQYLTLTRTMRKMKNVLSRLESFLSRDKRSFDGNL